MKKIGFIGVYDKTDLILCIAKVLTMLRKKILIVDATTVQKSKYVVPVINPTKSYVTEFEGIDVAVGFENMADIKQYMGLEDNESLEYDYLFIDTDNYKSIVDFNIRDSEKIYYATSFDAYSLKKGLEILNQLNMPLNMTKIFYTKELLKEEEDYFNYLALGIRVMWSSDKLYFLLENGDQAATIENQRIATIKLKNLSQEYRDNVTFLVNDIDKSIGEKKVSNVVKIL